MGVQQVVEKADSDQDSRVTLEEIAGFIDFDLIDQNIRVAETMGQPGRAILHLIGEARNRPRSRDDDQRFVAMWLTSLQALLDQPAYAAVNPTRDCAQLE